MAKNKNTFVKPKYRVNNDIHEDLVRIVGEGIESKIVTLKEAKAIASEMELDLIEINQKAPTPICKIASYEKMLYELKKAAKKNKASTKPLKEVQLSVNIADHDLQTKVNQAKKFIEEGSKVKVVLTMKGRELSRREDNKKSIYLFIEGLEEVATPESLPKDEGNKTIVILKKRG